MLQVIVVALIKTVVSGGRLSRKFEDFSFLCRKHRDKRGKFHKTPQNCISMKPPRTLFLPHPAIAKDIFLKGFVRKVISFRGLFETLWSFWGFYGKVLQFCGKNKVQGVLWETFQNIGLICEIF